MGYKEDFLKALDILSDPNVVNLFIMRNTEPSEMKRFPDIVGNVLREAYIDNLKEYGENAREKPEQNFFAEFKNRPESDCSKVLQVISTEILPVWKEISTAYINRSQENDYDRCKCGMKQTGNVIMMVAEKSTQDRAFFLTVYRNVASWYADCIRFADLAIVPVNKESGELNWEHEELKVAKQNKKKHHFLNYKTERLESDILALTPCVAAVIFGKHCFIIDLGEFVRIFKYEGIIDAQLAEHEDEIRNLEFVADGGNLWEGIKKSIRWKNEMLKVIDKKRLEVFRDVWDRNNEIIQRKISARKMLKIQFDAEHRMVVNQSKLGDILGVLSDRIHVDLITGTVRGMEQEGDDRND